MPHHRRIFYGAILLACLSLGGAILALSSTRSESLQSQTIERGTVLDTPQVVTYQGAQHTVAHVRLQNGQVQRLEVDRLARSGSFINYWRYPGTQYISTTTPPRRLHHTPHWRLGLACLGLGLACGALAYQRHRRSLRP